MRHKEAIVSHLLAVHFYLAQSSSARQTLMTLTGTGWPVYWAFGRMRSGQGDPHRRR